jgi:arginine N-succinyltransferase
MEDLRYEIRAATLEDADELYDLAAHLDSVNLPHDRTEIEEVLQTSERSFAGAIEDPRRHRYVFVLRDRRADRVVGTSMVVAQLGRREAPYIFFDVRKEERYSATLDAHFEHRVLSIGYSYHGPTEIGGLVVDPAYRRVPEKLGMLISYVRFLFLAMHRARFQDRVLAELMPPLAEDRTSHLWEAVGRKFTGMTYREADRLSKTNKEFIRGLFPSGDIYASLLPDEAREVIGEVGPETRGVSKLLTRIGFRYVDRVDPFDGGPHFIAPTDEIELVRRVRTGPVAPAEPDGGPGHRALLARTFDGPPYFLATAAAAEAPPEGAGPYVVEDGALARLGLQATEIASLLPLD